MTEADEAARDKPTALANYREQVAKGEAMGVIEMYERAARTVGATDEEIRTAREAAKVPPRSVYAECVDAGMLVEHHESDLYVKDTIEARAILERHGSKFSTFVDGKGEVWLDVPFGFDPFWKVSKEAP